MILTLDKLIPCERYSYPVVNLDTWIMKYETSNGLSLQVNGISEFENESFLFRSAWSALTLSMKRTLIPILFIVNNDWLYNLSYYNGKIELTRSRGNGPYDISTSNTLPLTPFHVKRSIEKNISFSQSNIQINMGKESIIKWNNGASLGGYGFPCDLTLDIGQVVKVEL